ncbi:MAG: hypothetical protein ACYCZ2_19610 [Lutibacter sp.]
MLQNKSTTIVSEVKGFFSSSEKATNTILNILSSLTLSEKQIGLQSKNNNTYKNINKLLVILMFPLFDIKDAWQYGKSSLFPVFGCGKDVFYRLLNDNFISWRKISFKISKQLIEKASDKSNETGNNGIRCLIVDDSDLPKTGRKIELIGRVFSHVKSKSILAFKRLVFGIS